MNDMDYEDDSDAMMDEDSADEYSVLQEAGFSEDQADAIVSAIRLCQSKGESSESEPPPSGKKGKTGSDALALLIGMGPKKGK
jgi:hypothetical protein